MNFLCRILYNILPFLLILSTVILFPIIAIPVIVVTAVIRSFVWVIAISLRPDLTGFVEGLHTLFMYLKQDSAAVNIVLKFVLENDVDLLQLQTDFHQRILCMTKKNELVYGRLQSTWESFMGYALWKRDSDFDLKNHVRQYDYEGALAIPSPCNEEHVNRVLASLVTAPWSLGRSNWEMLKVPNYEVGGNLQTVILLRLDHSLCDGYSLMYLFERLFQTQAQHPRISQGKSVSVFAQVGLLLKTPYDIAKDSLSIFRSAYLMRGNVSSGKTIVRSSLGIDVAIIKEIKNNFNVNFAAVVSAGICGGIERCLKSSGQEVPTKLTLGLILPRPAHPGGLTIHCAAMPTRFPIKSNSPVERLLKIQKELQRLNPSVAMIYVLFAKAGAYMPIYVRKLYIEFISLGISGVVSHFPVTTSLNAYNGVHEVKELDVTIGTWCNAGLMISSGGVNDKLRLSISAKEGIFGAEEAGKNLGNFVNDELQALLQSTA